MIRLSTDAATPQLLTSAAAFMCVAAHKPAVASRSAPPKCASRSASLGMTTAGDERTAGICVDATVVVDVAEFVDDVSLARFAAAVDAACVALSSERLRTNAAFVAVSDLFADLTRTSSTELNALRDNSRCNRRRLSWWCTPL
jgi:hypothetical protein